MGPTRAAGFVGAVLALVATSGCGVSLIDIDPPGAGPAGATYSIQVEFADALSLPKHGQVKQDGVVVGEVTRIEPVRWRAVATLALEEGTVVPENTLAKITQTSPLGETFVALDTPARPAGSSLADGDRIPLARTAGVVAIEDMLALMSTVTTGGSLESMQTIMTTLRTALEGRTGDVRSALARADRVMADLVEQRDDLGSLATRLASFTGEVADRRAEIEDAVTRLRPVVDQMAGQTDDIVALLEQMRRLSRTSTDVIARSSADVEAALRDAEPILRELDANSTRMRAFMQSLIRIAPLLDRASQGDYTNVDVTFTLTDQVQVPDLVDLTPEGEIPMPTLPPLTELPPLLGGLLGGSATQGSSPTLGELLGGLIGGTR